MSRFPKFFFGVAVILSFQTLGIGRGEIQVAGLKVELSVIAISDHTVRITLLPLDESGKARTMEPDRILAPREWPPPAFRAGHLEKEQTLRQKSLHVVVRPSPLTISIMTPDGKIVQRLVIDGQTGAVTFKLGDGPVLGLGGGGKQFDRRGSFDPMDNGHHAGEYQIFGSRTPIPFLIGTEGWALFFHRPYNGSFDLRGEEGVFGPRTKPDSAKEKPLPLDFFVIRANPPALAMSEFAGIIGWPIMPPKWALGYIQSHRTLAGPEEVISVAETFRRKRLPCDVLIYLGTGYCPAGWNTGHGSLEFNPKVFDQPKEIIDRLHALNFRVVLHKNQAPKTLHGDFPPSSDEERGLSHIADYWERHRPVFNLGVDGWWPDDGDELAIDSRLARHFIYFQGPLADRPNKRPFSLHRTGYAGMQRYGGWVWSGDVFSLWDTLAAHLSVGINFSLSASPFWGTDIGGFSPTKELTAELYVRWFQFMSFSPIFRSHGRVWHTRLPWGWATGELGPNEVVPGHKGTAAPAIAELRNLDVEPICAQYLNLRYQLLPYLYSIVREAYDTGMPIMRALWLHYPEDPKAVRCGDAYLWGRDILVAPVVQKGAAHRKVYLPEGVWYDFWSNRRVEGGQEVVRYVDLSTMPIYVRAGSIIPSGPVLQYVNEPTDKPLTLRVYPGNDGEFVLYEDDGETLGYLKDDAVWTRFLWSDRQRVLIVEPGPKSVGRKISPRRFEVLLVPENITQSLEYEGSHLEVKF